jgi:hypothetical protein
MPESDVFDSPEQGEDYRDVFTSGVRITATRRPGFAGRPRGSTTVRLLSRRRSSFVPLIGPPRGTSGG